MKTNLADLSQFYKDYLEDNKPSSRDSCPSPEKLALFVRSKRRGRDQKKFLDHATRCAYCLSEIKGLLDIRKAENTFILEMSELRNSAGLAARRQARPLVRRWSWNAVSLISAFVLLAAMATFSVFYFSSRSDYRRGPTADFRLISPVDRAVSADDLKFIWESVPRAKSYILETFDMTLNLLWRSELIAANEFQLSPEIVQKLRPNERYFWMVTAVFEGGNRTKSGMAGFSIRK